MNDSFPKLCSHPVPVSDSTVTATDARVRFKGVRTPVTAGNMAALMTLSQVKQQLFYLGKYITTL